MRQLVDVLVALAVLGLLVAVGFRFFSPNLGFALFRALSTASSPWRGEMGLLAIATVLVLRQIRDKVNQEPEGARIQQGARTPPKAGPSSELVPMAVFILTPDS